MTAPAGASPYHANDNPTLRQDARSGRLRRGGLGMRRSSPTPRSANPAVSTLSKQVRTRMECVLGEVRPAGPRPSWTAWCLSDIVRFPHLRVISSAWSSQTASSTDLRPRTSDPGQWLRNLSHPTRKKPLWRPGLLTGLRPTAGRSFTTPNLERGLLPHRLVALQRPRASPEPGRRSKARSVRPGGPWPTVRRRAPDPVSSRARVLAHWRPHRPTLRAEDPTAQRPRRIGTPLLMPPCQEEQLSWSSRWLQSSCTCSKALAWPLSPGRNCGTTSGRCGVLIRCSRC